LPWRSYAKPSKAHHAEGLVNPKVRAKFFGYWFWIPQSMRFRKHQILNRSPELPLPTFYFINVAKIGKNGPKIEFFNLM
jgi:hypothetical protein